MHDVVPAAEEILDKEFPVLDKGFVRLVDYMGGDSRIVQSARVSYGAGTKSFREDRGLIRYLMRHEHTSPFEQVQLTFHAKMPIFVARQWVRHRTARLNEVSGRYSVLKDEFYLPDKENINPQNIDNKQGRSEETYSDSDIESILAWMESDQKASYKSYKSLLEKNVAKELARIDLPLSTYTEWYWNIDLHNLFHFLGLRMDAHAQLEIRKYAEVMAEMTKKVAPSAWEAFEDYKLNAITFSTEELRVIKEMIRPEFKVGDADNFEGTKFITQDKDTGEKKFTGEGLEFQGKLDRIFD